MEFEWDDEKDRLNKKSHKVSFMEAVDTFYDPKGFRLIDTSHSKHESRYYWVGISKSGRVLTTYFTVRFGRIRIIGSAQWRKFRRLYFETTKNE